MPQKYLAASYLALKWDFSLIFFHFYLDPVSTVFFSSSLLPYHIRVEGGDISQHFRIDQSKNECVWPKAPAIDIEFENRSKRRRRRRGDGKKIKIVNFRSEIFCPQKRTTRMPSKKSFVVVFVCFWDNIGPQSLVWMSIGNTKKIEILQSSLSVWIWIQCIDYLCWLMLWLWKSQPEITSCQRATAFRQETDIYSLGISKFHHFPLPPSSTNQFFSWLSPY